MVATWSQLEATQAERGGALEAPPILPSALDIATMATASPTTLLFGESTINATSILPQCNMSVNFTILFFHRVKTKF